MDRLFGSDKDENADGSPNGGAEALREGVPVGLNQDEPVLFITDAAKEKIVSVLQSQSPPATTLRVSATGRGRYAMNLEPEGRPGVDDTVLPYSGFHVFVASQSLPLVQGAALEWVDTYGGGGFQFTNPTITAGQPTRKEPPEGPEGDVWRLIQQVIDEEVNPAVAMHGGHIDLLEVTDNRVYVLMGGGCQGCGMASITLKSGVERLIREKVPEIEEILDVTDHAGGTNPYYAPSTK